MSIKIEQTAVRKVKEEGMLIRDVAEQLGVSTRQVYTWVTSSKALSGKSTSSKTATQLKLVDLESEVRQLKRDLKQKEANQSIQETQEVDTSYCDARYIQALCG